ncbi:MAG: hypothetical protein KIT46_06025 [Anaerolineales bacterium]|nr:hypothetical protein [Anaerolineales bacterium]MCW5855590.1 hypothetical protein [Anaerolineales bacterium]
MPVRDALATSQKLFVQVLRWYPPGFRRAYGDQIAQVFRDCSREALESAGTRGLIGLWLATLPDLFKTALQEHFHLIGETMKNLISNPKSRTMLATLLCFPMAAFFLLDMVGVSRSWSLPASAAPLPMLMLLAGLALYGAPLGTSVLFGLLVVLPFAVMELVNRRDYGEDFPFVLFGSMWFMASLLSAILTPLVRNLRSGKFFVTNPASLVVRGALLVVIGIGFFTLLADQMPCFLGVRHCD